LGKKATVCFHALEEIFRCDKEQDFRAPTVEPIPVMVHKPIVKKYHRHKESNSDLKLVNKRIKQFNKMIIKKETTQQIPLS
jgi:hypothetical protein